MRRLDVTGERYHSLIAIKRIPSKYGTRWSFACDCGGMTDAFLSNVRTGKIRSCGCLSSRNTMGQRSTKHGHSVGFKKSKTRMAYGNAKNRCFNPNSEKFLQYGGRGITMCDEWVSDFRAFLRDMGECPVGLTLDRINVNGNYEPGNCRWATPTVQANNKQNSIRVGDYTLKEYAASVGVKYKRLHYRIKRHGETPEQAVAWFKSRLLARNSKRNHFGLKRQSHDLSD